MNSSMSFPCRMTVLSIAMVLPMLAAPAQAEAFLEDPFGLIGVAPTDAGGKTATLGLGFTRARDGQNRNLYGGAAEAEAGLVEGLDLRFAQTLEYGAAAPNPSDEATRVWGGLTQLGLRWQIVDEEGWRPAMGVFGALRTAYGETSRPSQSAQIVGLLSKTLIEGERKLALTVNAGWSEIFNAIPGERSGRYEAAVGLAQNIGTATSLGLSYLLNQQDHGEKDQNIIAAGLWHRLGDTGPILGFGAGAGVSDDSPRFLVFASAKWVFGPSGAR